MFTLAHSKAEDARAVRHDRCKDASRDGRIRLQSGREWLGGVERSALPSTDGKSGCRVQRCPRQSDLPQTLWRVAFRSQGWSAWSAWMDSSGVGSGSGALNACLALPVSRYQMMRTPTMLRTGLGDSRSPPIRNRIGDGAARPIASHRAHPRSRNNPTAGLTFGASAGRAYVLYVSTVIGWAAASVRLPLHLSQSIVSPLALEVSSHWDDGTQSVPGSSNAGYGTIQDELGELARLTTGGRTGL